MCGDVAGGVRERNEVLPAQADAFGVDHRVEVQLLGVAQARRSSDHLVEGLG